MKVILIDLGLVLGIVIPTIIIAAFIVGFLFRSYKKKRQVNLQFLKNNYLKKEC